RPTVHVHRAGLGPALLAVRLLLGARIGLGRALAVAGFRLTRALVLPAAAPSPARPPPRLALSAGLIRLIRVRLAVLTRLASALRSLGGGIAARAVRRARGRLARLPAAGLIAPGLAAAGLIAPGLAALAVTAFLRLLALRAAFAASAAAAPRRARALAALAAPAALARAGAPFASSGRGGLAAFACARLDFLGLRMAAAVQPAEHALPEARLAALRGLGRGRLRGRGRRQHFRDGGFLDLHRPLDLLVRERRVFLRLDHLVARRGVLGQVRLVVAHSPDRVVRRVHVRVADQHDLNVVALLDRVDPLALLVQQVVADVDRQRRDDLCRALLARLLADEPQDRERERLDASDVAGAVAAWADGLRRLLERR